MGQLMKMLYLIHVCWEWIFQRPQIIELLLEKDYDCTVVNKKYILGKTVTKNNIKPANLKNVWLIPKQEIIPGVSAINDFIYKTTLKQLNKYDAIWICHPLLFKAVPDNYKGKIIYDCMDNHSAMSSEKSKKVINDIEDKLLERADLVFISSEKLRESNSKLNTAALVRNGFSAKDKMLSIKVSEIKERYKIAYIGTISTWFDFNVISQASQSIENVEFHLIGPIENSISHFKSNEEILSNSKIIFDGVIEHDLLSDAVDEYDALIMPFVLNDIVLAVDPVKLYEYINFGKCIISIWYSEIDRFAPFVYFYNNSKEFTELISKLSKNGFPPKYTEKQRKIFLEENSWETRYKIIKDKLDSIL